MAEKRPVHSRSNRESKKTGNKERILFFLCISAEDEDQRNRVLFEVPTTKIKKEVRMTMTQERANEIAYLGCVRGVVRYCDFQGITELTATEFLLKGEAEEEFAENIANVFHLEKEEATAFTRFIFKDVTKALLKRKEEVETEIGIEKMRAEHGVYS